LWPSSCEVPWCQSAAPAIATWSQRSGLTDGWWGYNVILSKFPKTVFRYSTYKQPQKLAPWTLFNLNILKLRSCAEDFWEISSWRSPCSCQEFILNPFTGYFTDQRVCPVQVPMPGILGMPGMPKCAAVGFWESKRF
jgi:hypothetical protein